jgi:hypothetical protein
MSIPTLWFNAGVLWLMNVLLYIMLRLNILRYTVQQINRIKLSRMAKKMSTSG